MGNCHYKYTLEKQVQLPLHIDTILCDPRL